MQDAHRRRQGRQRRLRRQAGGRRAALVEAVARAAGRVDLGERERRGLVGPDDRVEADGVLGEHALVGRPEAVTRQPSQEGDRLLEAPDRPRGVEGAPARVRADVLRTVLEHEVEQRLAADEDDRFGGDRLGCAHEPSPGASSPEPRSMSTVGSSMRRDGPS